MPSTTFVDGGAKTSKVVMTVSATSSRIASRTSTIQLKVIERIPNEKVVWLVLENHMNHVEDQTEWVGTTISFDIAEKGDQTEVRFAHLGLLPQFECFDVCSNAWGSLMGSSLPSLIATGTGHPYK